MVWFAPASTVGEELTVTLNEQEETLHEFVAVHVTTVVPVANELPLAGVQITVASGEPVDDGSVHDAIALSH